ncbi:MAG: hypothetical protein D3910_25225, partial [Candidatus Electrothrix sp. ATG2]|nr:hypothetical protein [Candidatus Electrothrix sp. ATG2]
MKFIELGRRFRDITEEELGNPELLFSFGESVLDSTTDDWKKLLESRRVVLLAEAGSGKTEEMKAQARRLKEEEGKYAFYADLAPLDHQSLLDSLSADDEQAFTTWKSEHDIPAWFFLDSVDELKLTQGKLKRAVNRFAKGVYEQLDRVYVIISCRPSDWKFDLDLEAVKNTLPIHYAEVPPVDLTGEELFLAPLRRDDEKQEKVSDEETNEVRTVIMLPLTPGQIKTYAHSCGAEDVEAFIEEIQQQEAWLFANRPLDCENLVRIWNDRKELGTRPQQHEANITAKLKDDSERPDNNLLSNEKARAGAERLALALALTRT